MKDNFSTQSNEYARFRPGYPSALFSFLFNHCQHFDHAWDCATGNGQIAQQLAGHFHRVEATDISEKQLKNAAPHPNIRYSLQAAETPDFADASFDLIVVGQAAHWFDLERFYPEARRVLKPGGLLALVGYTLMRVDDAAIEALVDHLYEDILGHYWDPERRLVETEYRNIPFPFAEIPFPTLYMEYQWTREQLTGFFNTWSALQHYVKKHGHSPMDAAFLSRLAEVWPDGTDKTVRFPVFGRIGRCVKQKN